MKRIIAIAAAAAVSAASAFALDITVGGRGNFNWGLGTTLGDDVDDLLTAMGADDFIDSEGGNLGGGFGIYGNVGFLELGPGKLGAQLELGLAFNNGYSLTLKDVAGGDKISASTMTIDIPVLVTYTAEFGKFSVGGGLGPYLSIPVAPKLSFGSSDSEPSDGAGINFGLALDANAGYQVGPGSIVLDVRYMLDFTPTKFKYVLDVETFTRRNLQIGLGYQVKFEL